LYPVPTEKTRGSAVVEDVIRNDILVVAPVASLARRRVLFGLLVALSIGGLVALLTRALSAGGFGALDFILVVLFAVTLPWSVIGFWNGVIGLLIMRFARDPVALVMPAAATVGADEAITASTAILLCVRNE